MEQWKGFTTNVWQKEVNVRDFILNNFQPYEGDESFLQPPTEATTALWDQVMELSKKSVKTAVFLTWIRKSYQPSHRMDPAI